MWWNEIECFIKNHVILVSIWCILLFSVLYTTVIHWIRKDYEISCDDAIFLVNRKNAVIIDVRTVAEYESGYIINSINLPLTDIKKNSIFLCKKIRNDLLIIVCGELTSSLYSTRKYLNELGFEKVYVLKGGIRNWKNYDLPLLLKK